MKDADCVAFLQWALPQLGLHWPGFRKVRRQVCRRIAARLRALELADAAAYRGHLQSHSGEWPALAVLCTVTISRFYRDREVFDCLGAAVLPALAAAALEHLSSRLRPGGALVIGVHEKLPADVLAPWPGCRAVFRFGKW